MQSGIKRAASSKTAAGQAEAAAGSAGGGVASGRRSSLAMPAPISLSLCLCVCAYFSTALWLVVRLLALRFANVFSICPPKKLQRVVEGGRQGRSGRGEGRQHLVLGYYE